MRRPPLPEQARWIFGEGGGAFLHWHFACIASVRPDGNQARVSFNRSDAEPLTGPAPSVAKGMIFVERWLAARRWHVPRPQAPRAPKPALQLPPMPARVIQAVPRGYSASDMALTYQPESRTLNND